MRMIRSPHFLPSDDELQSRFPQRRSFVFARHRRGPWRRAKQLAAWIRGQPLHKFSTAEAVRQLKALNFKIKRFGTSR